MTPLLIHKTFFFQAKDILAIHNSNCPNANDTIQVSLDGVSECKSNLNSIDVYSIRFTKCRTIYPLKLVRPIGKYRVDQQNYLDEFLSDVCTNNCHIHSFVGDNLKRSTARASKTHSSYHPCEYCFTKGTLLHDVDNSIQSRRNDLIKQKDNLLKKLSDAQSIGDEDEIQTITAILNHINDSIKLTNKKNNNIVWPCNTYGGPLRTIEEVIEICDKIENNPNLSIDEAKGIMGRSLFLDIPYFRYVEDIPTEYLHSVCIGVVKRTVELTFNVGDNRQRNTNRKLSSVDSFNKLMCDVQVVRECSRRARALDFSVMKGQEFRNIVLIMFPIVIQCIEPQAKERRLWLLLAYMIRVCVLPSNEYDALNPDVVKYCGYHFYKLYEHLFHARNCSYNTHVVSCHLDMMRIHGPLTFTSAFVFESFYGEMRHSFTPGTVSPLKQIMEKILLKRTIAPHCCESSIYYSPNDSPLECNSLIYTFNDNEYQLFKIVSIEDTSFHCYKVGKYEANFIETPTLNWSKIGVFKAGGISDELVTVEKDDIAGKVIRVLEYFITCPINVLREK